MWFLISICEETQMKTNSMMSFNTNQMHTDTHTQARNTNTYKVLCAAQPLGSVLLQEALQQVSGCVGNVGFQLQGLVQDVVVHLRCVTAVERRLGRDKKNRLASRQQRGSSKESA